MMTIPIFFDFGGTIVDNIDVTRESFKQVFNKEFTAEQIKQMYKDMSKRRQSMYLFFKYPVNPLKLLFKRKKLRDVQKDLFFTHTKLFPDAKKVFQKISKLANLQLVIVTQNPRLADERFANSLLNKLFDGEHPFDLVLAGQDKLELITQNFSSEELEKSLIVGDLRNDMYIAEILRIPGIGVTWGYSLASELDTPFIADDYDELYEHIIDHLKDIEVDKESGEVEGIQEIPFDEEF